MSLSSRISQTILFAFLTGSIAAQTPGAIFEVATTSGNPLDPNSDGFITSSGAGFVLPINEESTDFEGTGWTTVYHQTTEPTSDLDTGANCGSSEIVDNQNTGQHACYVRLVDPDSDPTNRNEELIVRMRIAQSPTGAFGYSMLIDTDLKIGNTGPNADPNYTSGNPGFEVELILGTGGSANGVQIVDVDGTTSGTQLAFYSGNARRQRSYAANSNCGGTPVFLDFYVSFADFPTGVTSATSLRFVFATASSPSTALGGSASDIGGIDDTTLPSDDAAFSSVVLSAPVVNYAGIPPADADGDGIADSSDLCIDLTACNYTANPTAACTYATTWYLDSDGDGTGVAGTTQVACTAPSGYVAISGDACPSDPAKTAAGVCGCGNVDTDTDSDGVCDTSDLCTNSTACNYTANPTAACTYATTWYQDSDGDGAGDPGVSQSACTAPSGYVSSSTDGCPSDAAKTAPGLCGCGNIDVNADSDTVCDTADLCTDLTATNYAANPSAACTYTTSGFTIDACDGQASVSFDLDTMTVATNSWTYSILSSISGFATEALVTDLVTLDFSPTGVGNDTLLIQATTGAVTENIQIVVNEWEYPVRTSPLTVTAASSPAQIDGTISTTFTGHYGANVTLHANGTTVPMVSGVGVLRSAHYVVEGYTNVKGCYNPEPATSSTPSGSPAPVNLVLPCLKCH
jgi:hypothetical protein